MTLRTLYKSIIPYEQRMLFYKLRHPEEYKKLCSSVNPSDKGSFSLKSFDEHQSLFIHITKTAGTSVAKSLFNYLPYHYTAIEYRVIYGRKKFNTYFKFAFVRNPWDRLYSAYRYLKSGGWNEKDREWAETHLSVYEDFNHFIKEWLSIENINNHLHFRPQYEFICDNKKNILIDYIGYFENLSEDYDVIRKKISTGKPLGTHNTNPSAVTYKDIYDATSIRIVESVYKTDIQIFGYSFDDIVNKHELNNAP